MAANFFGQWLLERGLIGPEALIDAIEHQKKHNVSLGEVAIEKGWLTENQVTSINAEQQRSDRKFGEIAADLKLITDEQVGELLSTQKERRIFFGEALLTLGHIEKDILDREIQAHKKAQEEHEELLKADLDNIPEALVVKAMLDHTLKMFLRIAREVVKITDVGTEAKEISGNHYTFAQEITGEKNFYYTLTMPEELVVNVASKLLMDENHREITPLSIDAASEYVNIVIGHGCGKLGTLDCMVHAKPPFSYRKSEEKGPECAHQVTVELASAHGDLMVEFLFKN
ncbi:chemotaxis protein CheX [Piscirickettsia litoralis]|uniref:Chemotaxis phosphatase CheX-like domain-containing protein n=1 Tax=Piscirickettsia litoralis TaxID=1891921 RepID=A0ABX3A837_9GAMM|nr:chemotaxis protein CheX [Piscirickettsia litoralis]ODN43808.1 hypothetical protein BGC07_14015 [Piscirickettsia litoralis]